MKKAGQYIVRQMRKIQWTSDLVFCFCAMLGVLITMTALWITHGQIFSQIFHADSLDTGMDFFHSIEYTRGASPYKLYHTLYPPLANFLFLVLFNMVPSWQYNSWANTFLDGVEARGTIADLRLYQPTLLLFLFFILFVSALFVLLVKRLSRKDGHGSLLAFCMLFSFGILYAVERGNIILLSLIGTMVFVFYKDSKKPLVREMALLSLAVAAGLKIYPAIFGLMLLYDKQYKEAARTILYGVVLFVLPVFAFQEGMGGISIFFRVLTSFASGSGELSALGFSFQKIVTSIGMGLSNLTGSEMNTFFFAEVLPKLSLVIVFLTLLLGFFLKKSWQKSLVCCLAFLLYSEQGTYALSFLLIPLLGMIRENKRINDNLILPYTALVASQVVLPLLKRTDSNEPSAYYIRFQICIIVLLIYCFYETAKILRTRSKNRNDKR